MTDEAGLGAVEINVARVVISETDDTDEIKVIVAS
jgi:hypothetical protein